MRKLLLLFVLPSVLLTAGTASASGNCQPVYGGGSVCEDNSKLTINKQIENPQTNTFVDSLGTNDSHFQPGQGVTFRITVTNTTSSQIKNITVKDFFPTSMQLTSGNGLYDTETHVLSFTIDSLNANTAKTYLLQGQIRDNNALPGNNPLVCLTNGATAESGSDLAQDNSQFCVEKTGTTGTTSQPVQTNQGAQITQQPGNQSAAASAGIPTQTKGGQIVYAPQGNTKSPATGPEILGYLILAPLGALGAFLRRKNG